MAKPEYAPFTPADLALLTPMSQAEFFAGRIRIEDDGINYYLSRKISSEPLVPDLPKRRRIAQKIQASLREATASLPPLDSLSFTSLFDNSSPYPTRVGIVARVEFDGNSSSPKELLAQLAQSLTQTINRSADQRHQTEMLKEGTELLQQAVKEGRNLLCFFTLGEFFVCFLQREKEMRIRLNGRLLISMSNQDIPALPRPTEPDSLYFLLRIKQPGNGRIVTVPPAEWLAFINCHFASRRNIAHPPLIQPEPIERILGIAKTDSKTLRQVILMPPFNLKPGASGEKPGSRKPPRRF